MSDNVEPVKIMDAKGRVLTYRNLTILDQARIMRAIGAEQSKNEPYVQLVQAACSVNEIDGIPVPMPTNERAIDACIGRIGDEGFAAIVAYMNREMERMKEAAAAALESGEEKPANPLPPSEPSSSPPA